MLFRSRDARGIGGSDEYQMWQMDTASEICKTHVGLVNQGATCYMNSLLQQLFMVPGFRDGFLSAAPPLPQRSPVVDELQRLFAYMALSKRKMVDPSAVLHALLAGMPAAPPGPAAPTSPRSSVR